MIFITAGFPLTPEIMSGTTAAISALNKANVAIYPIDVPGLTAAVPTAAGLIAPYRNVRFVPASYTPAGWLSSSPNTAAVAGVAREVVAAMRAAEAGRPVAAEPLEDTGGQPDQRAGRQVLLDGGRAAELRLTIA